MAGLPRSGSTLLTSLLNQNPQIYAAHQTALQPTVKQFMQSFPNRETTMSGYQTEVYKNVIQNTAQAFYEDTDKPIVIDKNREWVTPYSLNLAEIINEDVKIIFPYRPILEVLASFIVLAENNVNNYIDVNMQNEDFWSYHYRPINDARCDWLMKNNGQIDAALFGFKLSQDPQYKKMFHIVKYDNLCADPQKELNDIYNFIGLENYKNNFDYIENKELLNDGEVFGIPALHYVRGKITKVSKKYTEVLSDYVIEKYGNALESLEEL